MDIFVTFVYQPIFNLIVVLYRLFGGDLGLAIIAVALLSRLITVPIMLKQRKTVEKNKEMTEKINAVKAKHKNSKDKEALQKEMMAVQSEYLPGQLAGCLPAILQLIIFINIYNVIRALVVTGPSSFTSMAYSFVPAFADNAQLNHSFLGIFDLSKMPADFANSGAILIPYLIMLGLVGLTQYLSMKLTMKATQVKSKKSDEGLKGKDKGKSKGKGKDKDKPNEDFGQIVQQSTMQTMALFPILYMFISYNFPAGLSLYWIVQSTFVIIQQLIFNWYDRKKKKAKDLGEEVLVPNAIITQ